jgi:hypothetical protein
MHVRVDRLTIGAGQLDVTAGAANNEVQRVSRIRQIGFVDGPTPPPTFNLNNNSLIVDFEGTNSPRAQLETEIALGRTAGNGLVSLAADGTTSSLGIADAGEVGIGNFVTQAVDPTTTLIRFTRVGDANLDGTTNITDFARLAANFNQPGRWLNGDFDYTGVTNIQDFALLASNFNLALAEPARAAAVPEPVVEAASILVLLRRRRPLKA